MIARLTKYIMIIIVMGYSKRRRLQKSSSLDGEKTSRFLRESTPVTGSIGPCSRKIIEMKTVEPQVEHLYNFPYFYEPLARGKNPVLVPCLVQLFDLGRDQSRHGECRAEVARQTRTMV